MLISCFLPLRFNRLNHTAHDENGHFAAQKGMRCPPPLPVRTISNTLLQVAGALGGGWVEGWLTSLQKSFFQLRQFPPPAVMCPVVHRPSAGLGCLVNKFPPGSMTHLRCPPGIIPPPGAPRHPRPQRFTAPPPPILSRLRSLFGGQGIP